MTISLSVVEKSVFVDKSMLIADVIDSGAMALLFCRPRRFGKSLNLSMIQRFLEIPSPSDPVARDTTELFEGLAIWDAAQGQYRAHHAAYPVISISLKTAKTDDAAAFLGALAQIVGAEYERHRYVLSGGGLNEEQQAYFERVTGGAAEAEELVSSLEWLSRVLTAYHGRRTVVLIDEYDAPVAACYTKPSYHEIVSVLKRWLTGALKGNPMLEFAVLTGVQRISKESIFSDLNNLVVDTPLDVMADERYGFLEKEVAALATYLGADASLGEAREWYDGYRFGTADVFNPWSVVNYFRSGGVADIYWGNTSSNDVLQSVVESACTRDDAQRLLADDRGGNRGRTARSGRFLPRCGDARRGGMVAALPGRLSHDRRCGPAEQCRPGASLARAEPRDLGSVPQRHRGPVHGPGRLHAGSSPTFTARWSTGTPTSSPRSWRAFC